MTGNNSSNLLRKFLFSNVLCLFFTFSSISLFIFSVNADVPEYSGDISSRQHIKTFILVGDTQRTSSWEFWREQNETGRTKVFKKIASENPSFILHLGDLVFRGASNKHWKYFDGYAEDIRKNKIAIFPVLGNHEYYGSNKEALKNFFSRFPHLNEKTWHTLRFHSVGIILFNSNFGQLTKEERKEQHEWYVKKMGEYENDSSINTILVACHHPPYTNSKTVSPNKEVEKYFVGIFKLTPKAKLFFSGHCHSYEHFIENDKHFIVSGGGGGPRQSIETNPKKQKYIDTYKGGKKREFHFCRVSIINEGIQVQMVYLNDPSKDDWTVGDEFTLK